MSKTLPFNGNKKNSRTLLLGLCKLCSNASKHKCNQPNREPLAWAIVKRTSRMDRYLNLDNNCCDKLLNMLVARIGWVVAQRKVSIVPV
jgi:hypothetical protein